MTIPASRRSRQWLPRVLAAMLLAGALSAATLPARAHQASAGAAPPVTWTKDPATIDATLTSATQTFTFAEVMANQSDPAGFGGFTFTLHYDASILQQPSVDLSPAIALFAAAARTLQCSPVNVSSGQYGFACASTGTFGAGPIWSGSQTMATVTFELQPTVAAAILSGGSGLTTTIFDTGVQVTNTCGQPLNDGSIQPIPGQTECQGVLLPGLGGSGVVINPGQTVITIGAPPTPTWTVTPVPTSTQTQTPTPTPTRSPTQTAVASVTARPSATADPSTTPVAPTAGAGTPPATASPSPRGTKTAAASATAAPPCRRDHTYWLNHADAWPVKDLALGGQTYDQGQLLVLLSGTPHGGSATLAQELIAALLNRAADGPDPSAEGPIAAANAQLAAAGARLPLAGLAPYIESGMTWLAGALARSNNGCLTSTTLGAARTPGAGGTGLLGLPRTGTPHVGARTGASLAITALSLLVAILLVLLLRKTFFDDDAS